MTRNKNKHFAILDERVRKSTLEKRKESLFKKAKEITTLCGIDMVVIIQDPEDNSGAFWPSREEAVEKLVRFLNIPQVERSKKMIFHEGYLSDKVNTEIEKIRRQENKNNDKEVADLMKNLSRGTLIVKKLSLWQTNGLCKLVIEKLKGLASHCLEFEEQHQQQQQQQGGQLPLSVPTVSTISQHFSTINASQGQENIGNTTALHPQSRTVLMNDNFSMETTFEKLLYPWQNDTRLYNFPSFPTTGGENNIGFDPNVAGSSGGFNHESFLMPNQNVAGSSAGEQREEQTDDPNSGWPYNYFFP